jgi:hypothetical protein
MLACGLAPAIGEQLVAGNVASFFPGLLILAWRLGGGPAGAVVGLMGSLKLAPFGMIGWLIRGGNVRGMIAAISAASAMLVVSLTGAGFGAIADYANVAATAQPSTTSVSYLTGVTWLSQAILVGGTCLAALLGGRPGLSFAISTLAIVFGTPALYVSGYVTLLAVVAPLAAPSRHARPVLWESRSRQLGAVPLAYAFARVPRRRRP